VIAGAAAQGQEDLCVATTADGRDHVAAEESIFGYFVRMMVRRRDLAGESPCAT